MSRSSSTHSSPARGGNHFYRYRDIDFGRTCHESQYPRTSHTRNVEGRIKATSRYTTIQSIHVWGNMPEVHRLSFDCNMDHICSISSDMSCGRSLYGQPVYKKMVRSSLSRPRRRLVLRWRDQPFIRVQAGQAWNRRRMLREMPSSYLRAYMDSFIPRVPLPTLLPRYRRPRHYVRTFRPMEADPWIAASMYVPGESDVEDNRICSEEYDSNNDAGHSAEEETDYFF